MKITQILTAIALLVPWATIAIEGEVFNSVHHIYSSLHPDIKEATIHKGESNEDNKETHVLQVSTPKGPQNWKLANDTIIVLKKDDDTGYGPVNRHKRLWATIGRGPGILCPDITKKGDFAIIFGDTDRAACDNYKRWLEAQSQFHRNK